MIRWYRTTLALFVLGLILFGVKVKAKEVIFSPLQGTVFINGKTLPGVILERTVKWDETSFVDKKTTDDNGRFSFPVITKDRDWLSWLLPSEPLANQTIEATYNGKNFKVWFHIKRNWHLDSENNGKPIRIECHLDKDPERQNEVFGLCEFI